MQTINIFRNLSGDFELIFPLIDITNADESFVSGKATELDSNTIIIVYRNASAWTTTTFSSGTPVEIGGSTGVYHITILNSWFTNRDEDYPIFIKIEDDTAPTRAWKTIPITIEGKLKLENITLKTNTSSNPGLEIDHVKLNSIAGDPAVYINDAVHGRGGITIVSDGNSCITLDQYDDSYPGILIGAEGNAIEISSWNKKGVYIQGFGGSSVKLEGYGTEPSLHITAEDNQDAIEIEAIGSGKAIHINNDDNTNPAVYFTNAGDGNAVTIEAQGTGNGVEYKSTTGYDIEAKELNDTLKKSDSIDGTTTEDLLSIIKAFHIGRYKKDTPSTGQLTIYANDNTTPLAIVTLTDTERTRDLPI